MARRILIVALVAFAALAALAALAWALSRGLERERLRAGLERAIASALDEPVAIGGLEGPLVPRLALRDLVIGPPEAPWLEVARIALDFEPTALAGGELSVELLEIEGPRISLRRSAQGVWNTSLLATRDAGEKAAGSSDARRPLDRLRFGRIVVRGGEARVEAASETTPAWLTTAFDAAAEGIFLPLDEQPPRIARASLTATDAEGQVGAHRIEAGTLSAELEGTGLEARAGARALDGRDVSMTLDASLAEHDVEIAGRATIAGDEALAVSLRAPLEALLRGLRPSDAFALDLRSERLDLSLLRPFLPTALRIDAGVATADLHFEGGSPLRIRGRAAATGVVADLPGVGRAASPLEGTLVLAPDARGARVDVLRLDTALGSVSGAGVIGTESLHDFALAFERLDPARLGEVFGATVALGGAATARFTLDGALRRPAVQGRIDWAPAQLGPAHAHRATLRITTDAERAAASLSVIVSAHEVLSGAAEAELPADLSELDPFGPGVRASVRGDDLDVSALQPFLPRQLRDLQGRAKLRLAYEGATPRPRLEGLVSLSEGSLSIPVLGTTWQPIHGALRLEDDALVLEALQVAGGSALARGRVELVDLRPTHTHLTLALRDFPLARSPLLTTDLSGDLVLHGPRDALVLEGEVTPVNARARVPEPDDPVLREIEVIAADTQAAPLVERRPPPPGALDRARADIHATIPRNTWLRGRGLELEIEGDLRILREPLGPLRLAGNVRSVRGRYNFQGKRFDVQRGVVTFDGAAVLDPLLDIDADHRVSDVIVKLHLEGRASDPKLSLSSQPDLEEEDVLSYLFFGRSANEVGPDVDFQSAAASFAVGVAASQAADLLVAGLPIETLDIDIGEDGVPEEVSVGAYLTDDLFVEYGRSFGSSSNDRVSIELRINKSWSIESEMSTNQSAGADLVWSYDF